MEMRGSASGPVGDPDQARVDEMRNDVQRIDAFGTGDRLNGVKVAATHECPQPPEHALGFGVEKVVTPRDRGADGSLSSGSIGCRHTLAQAVVEPA